MIVNPQGQWMLGYISKAKHLLPNIGKLKRITFRAPPKNKVTRCEGICVNNGGVYSITIHSCLYRISKGNPVEWKRVQFSMFDTLHALAHELAHIEFWDHTIDHKVLELKILLIFVRELEKHGYECEEKDSSFPRF